MTHSRCWLYAAVWLALSPVVRGAWRVDGKVATVDLNAGETVIVTRRGILSVQNLGDDSERPSGRLLRVVRDSALEHALSGSSGLMMLWQRLSRRWPRTSRVDAARYEANVDLTVMLSPVKPGWEPSLVEVSEYLVVRRNALLAASGELELSDQGKDGIRCAGQGFIALQAPGSIVSKHAATRLDVQAGRAIAWTQHQRPRVDSYAGARWHTFAPGAHVYASSSALNEPTVIMVTRPEPLRPGSGLIKVVKRLVLRSTFVALLAFLAFFTLAFATAGFQLAKVPTASAALAVNLAELYSKCSRAVRAATSEFSTDA